MPNQELVNFIKGEQQKGVSRSAITGSLLAVGWQQTQIDEAFGPIAPQNPPLRSMTSQEQYVPSSSGGHKRGYIGAMIIFLLLILCASAIVLFAYDKLPIKNYDLQNRIANVLMSIPFMPKTPRFVLETSANAHLKVTRFSFDTSIYADLSNVSSLSSISPLLGVGGFDAQVTGKIDYADIKNPLADVNVKITKDFSSDFRTKNRIAYFRVNTVPALITALAGASFEEFIQNQVIGKWFSVDSTSLNTDARANIESNDNSQSAIQEGFKTYLDAFNNQDVLKSLSMNEEKLNNIDTYHIYFVPNDDVLNVFWDKYTKKDKNTAKNSYSSNYKVSDSIKNLKINIWINKNTYFLQKSTVKFNAKSPSSSAVGMAGPLGMLSSQEQTIPVSISIILSDFNKPVDVAVPTDAVKYEDLVKSFMMQSTASSGGNLTSKQHAQANDTKRKSDVNAILNAVNQYMADNKGALPIGISKCTLAAPCTLTNNPAIAPKVDICKSLVPNYLAALPVDPLTKSGTAITKTGCTKVYNTNYKIYQNATTKKITVLAPAGEINKSIFVTR
jgi:hypothetical protein